jgi:hypothetical protein
VKTKPGATAVQVVWSSRRGSRETGHIGSAHDDAGLEALKAAAGQRSAAGQAEPGRGYRILGLDEAAGGDGAFRQLVLAPIIGPASKIDSFEPAQAGIVGSAACAS